MQRAPGFVLTPDRLVEIPMDQWVQNLAQMGEWALAYLPGLSIVAGAVALVLPFVTRRREDWWLWSVLVFWLAFYAFLGSTLYSRYVLLTLVPFALLTARAIAVIGLRLRRADRGRLASAWTVGASAAVVLSLAIPASLIVAAPTSAALPATTAPSTSKNGQRASDRSQWIADTTAAEPGPAIVLTNHVIGAPRDLAVALRKRTDLAVHIENRIRHPAGGVADDWRGHNVR